MFRYLIMLGLVMCPMLVAAGSFERVVYFVNDYDGSVIHEVSEAGSILRSVYHAPYGGDYYRVDETPAEQTFGYAGSLVQVDGLANMGYRFYDPQVGRFLSPDPVSTHQGGIQHFGRYHYAANNPYKFTDPDGREIRVIGSDEFKTAVADNIAKIQEGRGGAALISKLEATKHVITIKETSGGNSAQAASYDSTVAGKGSDSTVKFNPDSAAGGTDANGSDQRPAYVGLAHELGHARAMNLGKQSMDMGTGEPGTTPPSEVHSIANENMVRREHGLPERPSYYKTEVP